MGRERKPRPPAGLPRCIKCNVPMIVAKVEPKQVEGLRRYERRTFQCPDCGQQQTYTMGSTELTR